MKAVLLLLAVVVAALAAVNEASARQMCTPGGAGPTRTFCGPASSTLKYSGTTHHFKNGNCSTDASTWSINLGTITLSGTPKHKYFGITSYGKKPGTHPAAVSWQLPNGTNESLKNAKVTLARGLKKGTFKGTRLSGGKAYGSFRCK